MHEGWLRNPQSSGERKPKIPYDYEVPQNTAAMESPPNKKPRTCVDNRWPCSTELSAFDTDLFKSFLPFTESALSQCLQSENNSGNGGCISQATTSENQVRYAQGEPYGRSLSSHGTSNAGTSERSTVLQQTQLAYRNPHSTSESNYHIQTDNTENDQWKEALPRGQLLVPDTIPSEHSAEKLPGIETLGICWFAPMTSGSQSSVGEIDYGVRFMSAENNQWRNGEKISHNQLLPSEATCNVFSLLPFFC
ncbi:unnamed protein product [Gongylonema pulchrum]|uniref:Uncharacterized protein n=1 Tax=Gongylonema pulchrum TaxID=637853 RepID=A0A183D1G0_9BILA|nr:unnamed protein product [Gongylonema pulchrum]